MKLEGMIWAPPEKKHTAKAKPAIRRKSKKKAKA
jgi:hypothetical protein